VLVALLVGITVGLSFRIGAGGSGILAVFPVVLISIMLILHNRVGGKPTAAVLANAPLGLVGFALACAVLHFSAAPLGVAIALALALATSIGWSLAVLTARRHGIPV
jgi:succinate-acetate transporter protein